MLNGNCVLNWKLYFGCDDQEFDQNYKEQKAYQNATDSFQIKADQAAKIAEGMGEKKLSLTDVTMLTQTTNMERKMYVVPFFECIVEHLFMHWYSIRYQAVMGNSSMQLDALIYAEVRMVVFTECNPNYILSFAFG